MGIIDHISDLFTVTSTRNSKTKPLQTVEIKVNMDCDGCERRVKHAVSSIKGAIAVEVNRMQSRVSVTGYVDPDMVLKRVQNTVNGAEFWPYVEHNLAYYPYAPEAYDCMAPPGYVRNVYPALNEIAPQHNYAILFSDENVNSCSIM